MRTLKGFLPSHEEDATEEELLQLQGERVNIEGDHENEHLKSEAKAEKEMKRLTELLSIIDDAARVAEQHDLKLERTRRFTAALEDISSPYEELYNQILVRLNPFAMLNNRNCCPIYEGATLRTNSQISLTFLKQGMPVPMYKSVYTAALANR
ncbi:hypothetical protein M514_08714 [Trichuris suis]|uniref:Uncharacterized protein n=1 Tax=Trichuris suis TaxID=68888 RepID=A0A085N083_9BILA|nr:hypothetical protein M513_08714 [Trichuris suis]KFD62879.1 hypothetical protein M514_08714 [Trichuris suis]